MSDEIFTRLRSLLKAYDEHKSATAPGPRTGGGSDRKRQAGAEALRKVVRPVLDAFMAELKTAGHEASTREHTDRADAYPSVALSFTPKGGLASALMFKYDPKRGIVVQREVKAAPAQAQPAATAEPSATAPPAPSDLEGVRKRAEVGDPYEQVALATRYATGETVPQDYSMAVRWYLRAAEQGHVGAQDALGSYFWMGRGVPKDVTKAYFWSVLARAEGKETSKRRVALMTAQLTRPQALAIQQEANRFLRLHPPLLRSDSPY